MSDNATAPLPNGGDPRSALEPNRVMILSDEDQDRLINGLGCLAEDQGQVSVDQLYWRLIQGDTYANPTDELVRRTFAKRRLEAEIRKHNARIAELDAQLVEEWAECGRSKDGHAATGATLSLTRRVYAKLDVDTDGLPKDAADSIRRGVKAQVADVLDRDPAFNALVKLDVNLQTLSAIFAERIRDYDETQRALPEHERMPLDPMAFLPPELRGLLVIDATPHVQVRA